MPVLRASIVALALASLFHAAPIMDGSLEVFAHEWQRGLGLDAWRVSVVIVKPSDLHAGSCGHSRWDDKTHSFLISILSADDYVEQLGVAPDRGAAEQRITIIHELVHLSLQSIQPRPEKLVEENIVKRLTMALCLKSGISSSLHADDY